MPSIYLLNKPFQVLSQFSDKENRKTLADYVNIKNIYPAGRLDYDSEGLIILTGNGAMQARIAEPKFKLSKSYWVQLEGQISNEAIARLKSGVMLKDGLTSPASAVAISEPDIWPRNPPIRQRENQPTSWIELTITEGKNRQVRRMTAEVGYPTLRLIRHRIGPWSLEALQPGEYRKVEVHLPSKKSAPKPSFKRTGKHKQ